MSNDNTQQPIITDPTGILPFTFVDSSPHAKYVQVEEAMYTLTLERIRQLVKENDELKNRVQELERSDGELEDIVAHLDDDLAGAEMDRVFLSKEVISWRTWFDTEDGLGQNCPSRKDSSSPIEEPLLYQQVVNARAETDRIGCLNRAGRKG